MKKTACLFLLTACSALPLYGQRIEGRVFSEKGTPVEYVGIGIDGKNVGTVSDAEGYFSIALPDSLDRENLTFSHISFVPRSLPVTELKEEYARQGGINVSMQEYALEIEPIRVGHKQGRLRQLNKTGIRMNNGVLVHQRPSPVEYPTFNSELRGVEFGTRFTINREAWIREVSFRVLKNTFDSLVLRIGAYRVEDTTFVPLMSEPVYIDVAISDQSREFVCDLSQLGIRTRGETYIGLEIVQAGKKGRLECPLYLPTPMYLRETSRGELLRRTGAPGIRIRGMYID